MLLSLLLLLLSCSASGCGLLLQRRTARELETLRQAMHRVTVCLLEASRAEDQLENLRQKQQAAENAVHLGATAARDLHRGIAAIPFGILEAIPSTRDKARAARVAHDDISGAIHDAITLGNRALGSLVRDKLRSRSGAADADPQPRDPLDPGPR